MNPLFQHCGRFQTATNRRDFLSRAGAGFGMLAWDAHSHRPDAPFGYATPTVPVFERNLNPAEGKSGVPVAFAKRPLWLLRGQDRTGRNDLRVGH